MLSCGKESFSIMLLPYNKNVKDCFNRAAETYDAACDLQKNIGNKLINLTSNHSHRAEIIIDLGCGTGLFTEKIAVSYKLCKQIYAIDIADRLLIAARKRLQTYNIKFVEESFETFHFSNLLFDLAFSNMALHWSKDLGTTVANIYKNLSNGGTFAFSIPMFGTFLELRSNLVLPFYTLEDICSNLQENNFKLFHVSCIKEIQKFDTKLEALKSIKLVGANYYGASQNDKAHLSELLQSRKSFGKAFNLTYNIGFFIAMKN